MPPELQPLKEQISDIVDGLVAASRQSCKRSPAGFIPRSCPRADWVPRSRRWPAARPSRSNSTSRVDRRLPDSVEVAAYYVVAEALTNAAKHARALAGEGVRRSRGCQSATSRFATTGSGEPTPPRDLDSSV